MRDRYHPLNSLRDGHWFKLICGASYQHLPAVRNLTLAYTLAGADCIDVAADPATLAAAQEALEVANSLEAEAQHRGWGYKGKPLLMASLNDGEDPHFRKAEFNSTACPPDCWRPCEQICPAAAIVFQGLGTGFSGVIDQRCYGCGRCLPVCPSQLIYARSYVSTPATIVPLVLQAGVDAVEIHTQVGREADFQRLWKAIAPFASQLQLVAISCPDGEGLIDYLWTLYEIISPLKSSLIWQTDGRPMSGDIGAGATRAAIKLGEKVLAAGLPGYVQLAGGTNDRTVAKLKTAGLLKKQVKTENQPPPEIAFTPHPTIAGVAYGSYARVLLSPILESLTAIVPPRAHAIPAASGSSAAQAPYFSGTGASDRASKLEAAPDLLWQAVSLAHTLVSQLKGHG